MKLNPLLKNRFASFSEVERLIESLATTKQKGDVFEDFVYAYLVIKRNLYQIDKIYKSIDIPSDLKAKYKIANKDSGIDGIFILLDGRVASYQAKFRTSRVKPPYHELAKFWTESEHTDINYTIANCYSLTDLAKKKEKHLQILVDEFENLEEAFFSQLFDIANYSSIRNRIYFDPKPYQNRIIKGVTEGFNKHDRGKLIAACGTGKTLITLWITEALNSSNILFIAPSLALIKQSLESWSDQSKTPFSYLCICSDQTVSSSIEDNGDISIQDFNIPVTTDPVKVVQFLDAGTKVKRIVFSTYQSLPILAEALNSLPEFAFDISIFDEAHRTAGAKDSQLFSLALSNEYIKSNKRLFATATERLVKPWIKKRAEDEERIIFSMDDLSTYGPTFYRYNFGEAIAEEVISDYRIIIAGIKESELFDWIRVNKDLVKIDENSVEFHTTAYNLFSQLLLSKAAKEYPIRKIISFHSDIKHAQYFTSGYKDTLSLKKVLEETNESISPDNLYISHINGQMPTGTRKEILDHFKASQYGIVSNARCLTEGVDVPIIDCVYFVEPKKSLIDIVQACGRALRKPLNGTKELAYFIIPILIPDDMSEEEILNMDNFEMVFNVIQSLRDQDNRLSQWIDQINQNAVKGKTPKPGDGDWTPITVTLPVNINIKDFEEKLYLKIAEVNAEPTSSKFVASRQYGRNERKSNIKRIFRTLGDYSYESYLTTLVEPTLNKFNNIDQKIPLINLKINNNNVSHTEKLGLVIKEDKVYSLSPLGKKVFNKEIELKKVFLRQMMRRFEIIYNDDKTYRLLFPYRTCLKILLNVGSLNFYEFVFTIYSIQDSSTESVQNAINGINYFRNKYPRLNLVNEANQEKILAELNEYFQTSFTLVDIWGSMPTTVKNQFTYFKNHLSLFDKFIKVDKNSITLIESAKNEAEKMLKMDLELETETNIGTLLLKYLKPFVSVVLFTL